MEARKRRGRPNSSAPRPSRDDRTPPRNYSGPDRKQPARAGTHLLAAPWATAIILLASAFLSLWEDEVVHDVGLRVENATTFTVGPRGAFPKNCVWRELHILDEPVEELPEQTRQSTMYNHRVSIEFMLPNGKWGADPPHGCSITATASGPLRWRWADSMGPRSDVDCQDTYCTYKNLWYNNGKWYVLVDGPIPGGSFFMSKHVQVDSLHVISPRRWLKSVNWVVTPGETVVLDFPFVSHPTAIGHWPEILSPLYSILRNKSSHFGRPFKRIPDNFVLLHLDRKHFLEWARGVLATTLGIPANKPLPPVIMQEGHQLQGANPNLWICFPRAMIVKDMMKGGLRTFTDTRDARAFRDAIFRRHHLKPPGMVKLDLTPVDPSTIPRVITFMRKSNNRRIVNEEELLETLRGFGALNVVEFNSTTSLREQLKVMSETGLLVSSHSSQLANAQFLHPGAAVLELIQRYWMEPFDRSFQVQTEAMGDIHHFAWRCKSSSCTHYIDKRFGELYGNFSSTGSVGCMDRHTNVDVLVDCAAVSAILKEKLPQLWSDSPPTVKAARMAWPPEH